MSTFCDDFQTMSWWKVKAKQSQAHKTGRIQGSPSTWVLYYPTTTAAVMDSLQISQDFKKSTTPLASLQLPQEAYVLALAATEQFYAASASAPSHAIHLIDKTDCKSIARVLPGHQNGTICLRSVKIADRSNVLISCGKDGAVLAWDERTGEGSIKSESPSKDQCKQDLRNIVMQCLHLGETYHFFRAMHHQMACT